MGGNNLKKVIIFGSVIIAMGLFSVLLNAKKIYSHSSNNMELEDEDEEELSCGGTERWSCKVLTDNRANLVNLSPINTTISNLISLPTTVPTNATPRIIGLEDQVYTITATLSIKKEENDSDLHLVLSNGGATHMICEIPNPDCYAATLSSHREEYRAARNWVLSHMQKGTVYLNIPPVTVTGVAFVDFSHGQTGEAANHLELHPVLDIHFASESGINEKSKENVYVSVSPNPFINSTYFTITSSTCNLTNCKFELFNLMGIKVREISLPVNQENKINYTLNKENLSDGMYYYQIVKKGNTIQQGKLLIQ